MGTGGGTRRKDTACRDTSVQTGGGIGLGAPALLAAFRASETPVPAAAASARPAAEGCADGVSQLDAAPVADTRLSVAARPPRAGKSSSFGVACSYQQNFVWKQGTTHQMSSAACYKVSVSVHHMHAFTLFLQQYLFLQEYS